MQNKHGLCIIYSKKISSSTQNRQLGSIRLYMDTGHSTVNMQLSS